MWPFIAPLLAGLIVLPIFAIVGLFTLLELQLPALPSVDLPDVDVPSWLRAIAAVIGALLSFLGAIAKYVFVAAVIVLGVMRTRGVRRRRIDAETLGRTELLRRLEIALVNVETRAREQTAERVGDAARSNLAP